MKSIRILSELQEIGGNGVTGDNTGYCSESGILFDKDITILIAYPLLKRGIFFVSEGVIEIGEGVFF